MLVRLLRSSLLLLLVPALLALTTAPPASADSGSRRACRGARAVSGVNAFKLVLNTVEVTYYARACVRATKGGPGNTRRTYAIPWSRTPRLLATAMTGDATVNGPFLAKRWRNRNGSTRMVRYDAVVRYCHRVTGCTSIKVYFYENYNGTQIYHTDTHRRDRFDFWD